jgi:hypothetical protein
MIYGLSYEAKEMKRELQHLFNPLHLWCLCGGRCRWLFRLYENWLWQPHLRYLLTENQTRAERPWAFHRHRLS